VSNNTISNLGYTGNDNSTGILFWNSALTIDGNTITGAEGPSNQPVNDLGIDGFNSSNVTINGNTVEHVLEGIAASNDTADYPGVFAPDWSIGLTNTVGDATQYALDFKATGATGSFTVTGTAGNDLMMGGTGSDTFTGGPGNDTLMGGGGTDTAVYTTDTLTTGSFKYDSAHGDWVVTTTNEGTDTLTGMSIVTDQAGHRFLLVDPSSHFTTIQAAVDAAQAGDTILIAPGTYTETSHDGSGHFQGLHINTANLTLQGYSSRDGTAITTAADARLYGPTVISGAQNNFGANDWIDQGGAGAKIEGVHLAAGAHTDNKLIEITTDNVSLKNDFIDTFFNGTDTGTEAVYVDNQGTPINSYLIDHNILNEGIYVASGVGTAGTISTTQIISNNEFQGAFDYTTGGGRFDMVSVRGVISGIAWQPASAQTPTITGNTLDDNTAPFIFRYTEQNAALFPSASDVASIVGANTTATTTYAYVLNSDKSLHLVDLDNPGFPHYNALYVADSINTLDLGLTATNNVFGGLRRTMDSGDIVIVQGLSTSVENIIVDGLTVDPTATSNGMTFDIGGTATSLTVGDYLSGHGADVSVAANNLGDTIKGNSGNDTFTGGTGNDTFAGGPGNDTIVGGGGLDTAVYTESLTTGDFLFSGGKWTVETAIEGKDTLSGISIVADGSSGHRFLIVGADSQYTTIQAAVNAAHTGDTILLEPGTYTENVSLNGKAVNIEGFGGTNGVGGAVLDGSIMQTGALGADMTIEGLVINAAGQQNGISLTPTLSGPETVTINDVSIRGASHTGYIVNGGGTDLTADVTNSSFSGNGIAKTATGGSGDITYFDFLGNANFTNVQVTGVAQGTNLAHAGDNGIQISGFDEATHSVSQALGNVTFHNVSVTGTYAKTLVYIQGYDDASNLTFAGNGLTLGNATTPAQTGWTSIFVDLGPQGGGYTAGSMQPARVDLAGVTLAGWSLVGSNATFAPLAAAGLDDVIVGTPNTTDITGTPGNDAIIYNQAAGGVEHVDGGAGTDAEIINGTSAASTYNINPADADHLGIEILPGAHNTDTATMANSTITTTNVEEIVLNLGNGGDTVKIAGNLNGTGVAASTITINGGTGDDTIDLSKFTSNEDVVFNGGGGNGDTVILGFAFNAATYAPVLDGSGHLISASVTYTSANGPVTDTFTNVERFQFTDRTLSGDQISISAATAVNDFNGNGKADILWQNVDGTPAIWEMNGPTIIGGVALPNPGPAWKAIGTGDFNGDGKADILWQAADGTPAIWEMNGPTLIGSFALPNPGPAWKAIGTGDFNGDGKADILWQAADGTPAIWEMNGPTLIGGFALPNPGPAWKAIGTGDFNGDGKADILWQNANGTPAIWEMNGPTLIGGFALPNPGTAWKAIGTGDFNGDGKADILWQNTNGTAAIWEMNGATLTSGAVVANPTGTSQAVGAGDYNGDGKADILWQNTDGTPVISTMDGNVVTATTTLTNPGQDWHAKTG
jgi:hypothetical protein